MIDHLSPCDVQTTGDCTCTNGADPERLRAAIRLLYPDDITPAGKRVLLRIIEETTEAVPDGAASSMNGEN